MSRGGSHSEREKEREESLDEARRAWGSQAEEGQPCRGHSLGFWRPVISGKGRCLVSIETCCRFGNREIIYCSIAFFLSFFDIS